MNWTAADLLEKILEFNAMTPNQNEWSEKILNYNKPRLIRFQRIKALLLAFDVVQINSQKKNSLINIFSRHNSLIQDLTKSGILSFMSGEFIKTRDFSKYSNLISIIEQNSFSENKPIDIFDLERFYSHLIQYRISVYNVLSHNSGVLEASNKGFFAAINITGEANNNIKDQINIVDSLLVQIIDPESKELSEQELIDKYDFPKEDINEIDFENY